MSINSNSPMGPTAPSQAVPISSQASSIPPQVPSSDAPCNAASVDSFISDVQFMDYKSIEFFNEALAEMPNVPQGYWPHYHKELSTLLWEAMMTWCSTLKSKA
ncbi:hypothetical protein V8E55_011281 [Tylopilus felleus]